MIVHRKCFSILPIALLQMIRKKEKKDQERKKKMTRKEKNMTRKEKKGKIRKEKRKLSFVVDAKLGEKLH